MRLPVIVPLLCLVWGALACNPPGRAELAGAPPTGTSAARPAATPSSQPSASGAPVAPRPPVAPPSPAAVARLAQGSNAFGFDLYQRLRKDPGNLVFSPASITTALTMAWGGAKGDTAEQMRRVLHLTGTPAEVMKTSGQLALALEAPQRPLTFRIANQLFGEQTYAFEQPYLDQMRAAYGAPLERLDFRGDPAAARARVNGWVEGETEHRIKDLVPVRGITAGTRLVIVNALYFLGDWATAFPQSGTQPAPFFTTKDTKQDVPTMSHTASFRLAQRDGVTAVELPYQGGELSMLLVVPDAVDGLEAVEGSLDARRLEALVKGLRTERVRLSLPKFELAPTDPLALGVLLAGLGMDAAFDSQTADFTLIADPPNPADRIFIGEVFHKAFVKVDEKGTEAAAATAIVMVPGAAAPVEPREVRADRPFLFFIRDNASGLVLFQGRVADPSRR